MGIRNPTDDDVAAREDLTREKITELIRVDGRHPRPMDRHYPTVVSASCADSATADHATWHRFMRHITGLVRPGGLFVTAALRRCRGYTVAGKTFPSANIDEHDLRAVLQPRFGPLNGTIQVRRSCSAGPGRMQTNQGERPSPGCNWTGIDDHLTW